MSVLTPRQQQVLDLIRRAVDRTGFPPTRAEIAAALGFKSANAAEDHLRALARKGVITLTAGASRGIRLHSAAHEGLPPSTTGGREPTTRLLPLIGRVAAGHPVWAPAHVEREIPMDTALFSPTPDYLLRVTGLSMRDAGILDGDLLAVKQTLEARNGQIVVARLGDEVTVKRLLRQGTNVSLLPENADFQPVHIKASDAFALEGIVVGVIRPC